METGQNGGGSGRGRPARPGGGGLVDGERGAEYSCDGCGRIANGKLLDDVWWSAPFGWYLIDDGEGRDAGVHACSPECARLLRPVGSSDSFEVRIAHDRDEIRPN